MLVFKQEAQVINYVNNGSFEECVNCTSQPYSLFPKYWRPIDSTSFAFFYCGLNPPLSNLPLFNPGYYQQPRSGSKIITSTLFCSLNSCPIFNARNYPLNRLKTKLKSNTVYCLKYYVVNVNVSTVGIDAFGAYFGDESLDTIKYCRSPLVYLNAQVQNPVNNIIKDTLNWIPVTGTFVANGNEKYMVLGNFKSDAATNTLLINSAQLPMIATDVFYDDVSVIELNLPAFAGRDTSISPGSSVFLGRQPDVGIDEACVWYKLPNTTPIDTVAGFWVQPTATSTYVVEQTICGLVKKDTVVIHMNLTGLNKTEFLNKNLKLWPVPAQNQISLSIENPEFVKGLNSIYVYNVTGQMVLSLTATFDGKVLNINTESLIAGTYFLVLETENKERINKRFLID